MCGWWLILYIRVVNFEEWVTVAMGIFVVFPASLFILEDRITLLFLSDL